MKVDRCSQNLTHLCDMHPTITFYRSNPFVSAGQPLECRETAKTFDPTDVYGDVPTPPNYEQALRELCSLSVTVNGRL